MTTIRIAQRHRFTTVGNETVEDLRLSYRALGLLLWLLSKPDNWKVNAERIARETEGRRAILTALKELETAGYLRREKVQMPSGHWQTHSYLYESPECGHRTSVDRTSVDSTPITKNGEVKTENKTHSDIAFTEFWNAYPASRRGGSPSAKRAWKKIDPEEHLAIMLGLSLWVKFWKDSQTDDQFIKLAASWLNDRRWECPPESKPGDAGGPRWDEKRHIWLAPGVG